MKSTDRLLKRIREELGLQLPADTTIRVIRRQGKNCIYGWKWALYSPTHIWVLSYGGPYTVAETVAFKGIKLTEFSGGDFYVEPA